MGVGVILFAGGFTLSSTVQSLFGFYTCFVLLALGSSFAGFLSIIAAIAQWFDRRRSMAIGLMLSGMSMGGLLVPGVIWLMTHVGWRSTALVSAAADPYR